MQAGVVILIQNHAVVMRRKKPTMKLPPIFALFKFHGYARWICITREVPYVGFVGLAMASIRHGRLHSDRIK